MKTQIILLNPSGKVNHSPFCVLELCKQRAWTLSAPSAYRDSWTSGNLSSYCTHTSPGSQVIRTQAVPKSRGHTVSIYTNHLGTVILIVLCKVWRGILLKVVTRFNVFMSIQSRFKHNIWQTMEHISHVKAQTKNTLPVHLFHSCELWVIHMDLGQPPYCLVTRGNI